ncbi:tetratricopeptide repeat protein 23 isoform X2 [Poeciliopsis prolifica]|uniref:tetratricopeptide repeat protein 23 isoform X2 n=1 Tax=Poeciliopsis prolifica TaxID=188132 RepID=UPI00241391C0|nr:tetratricopeptide repeat protein 23 isoform X2 [Poeciliopsis prolifica]
MEDDQAERRERNHSSTASLESNESTNSGRFYDRPTEAKYDKDEFLMMSPEEKLKHFRCRAQTNEDNQKFDACIQDLVRCVALTQLVCGERQLKLAQAHARLAKAYFQFKGWGLQALEHLAFAKELLLFRSSVSAYSEDEKLEVLACHLSVHLTKGGASLLTDNLEEAVSSFQEAEKVLMELYQRGVMDLEEKITTQLEITSGLCRVYARQTQPEEALSQCEKSLDLLKNCNKHERMCAVYKDMATIEQDRDHLDKAIDYLSKAHTIAMSHSPEGLEGAQISHSLAMILSAAPDQHHNETAGHYFEQSLRAYKNSVGPLDPAFLAAQDDFCRYLLINGQEKKCVEIQRASLESKISTFGDLSSEVAETLQLIGGSATEGQVNQAHRTMTKCLDVHNLLYGPQHKKSKAVQKAVDMLARAPEVVKRQQQRRRQTKLDIFPVIPPSGKIDDSTCDA